MSEVSHGAANLHKQQNDIFYMHRNMLNEKEHTNLLMFETLNSKLTDEEFINQAIENNQRLQLVTESGGKGPFDRNTNPFEQFR
jgi:hypothetical protein